MSDVVATLPAEGAPALPPVPVKPVRLPIEFLRRYLSPLSALTLAGVVSIFVLCAALWDIAWLRPYLAAGGAGLAAFLGPIPGIISPESRVKWLASVLVAALITAGTWLATQDLEGKLSSAEGDLHSAERRVIDADRATQAAHAIDQAHDAFVGKTLAELPANARDAVFITAAGHLWSLYHDKQRVLRNTDHELVADMAGMLLDMQKDNGHALYYAGEANARLMRYPEMIGYFQTFLATARDEKDATNGSAEKCYARPHGYCAERVGWINHVMAEYNLSEALARPDDERGPMLAQALDYEEKAVSIVKWPPSHHHKGFDGGRMNQFNSSCKILFTIIAEYVRMGIDAAPIVAFGTNELKTACGKWPSVPATPQ